MKRYKHKITGDEVEYRGDSDSYFFGKTQARTYFLPKSIVENSNDWELLVVKDYEILSFLVDSTGSVPLCLRNNGLYRRTDLVDHNGFEGHSSEYCLNHINHFNIHSIKRLSDGEIFVIGDNVNHFDDIRDNGKIYKFEISKTTDKLLVHFKGIRENIIDNKYSNSIDVLIKQKQLLFKTEDGVDIYKGDIFIHVDTMWNIGSGICNSDTFEKLKGYKEFSTKEKAKEYINNKKPQYSLEDIAECFLMFDKEVNDYENTNYLVDARKYTAKLKSR